MTKWAEESGKEAKPPVKYAEEFRRFQTSG